MDAAAVVVVCRGKAYVPTQGRVDRGMYLAIDPVRVADLDFESLSFVLAQAIEAGNPEVVRPTIDEMSRRPDPILRATRARSWTALARQGGSYGVEWTDREVILYMSKTDEKGRFVDDPAKTLSFQLETDAKILARTILTDVWTRPEVQG